MRDVFSIFIKAICWPLFVLQELFLFLLCRLNLYHLQVPAFNLAKDPIGERCAYCGKPEKERPS